MSYRTLDPDRIVETLEQLNARIEERFPGAGLGHVCRLLDELSGWVRCFWVVGLLLNPVGRAFPVDVTGGGQGRAL
jgi:hypothetical protein